MTEDAERLMKEYLNNIELQAWPRSKCCGSSRGLYCPECAKLLVPSSEDCPGPIRDGSLRLPFDLDILIDVKERRSSSTGLHLRVIFDYMKRKNDWQPENTVRVIDLKRESMPSYDDDENNTTEGTFVLYPKDSVPISSVGAIRKLIVLDCKWSRTSVKMHKNISKFPRVHLENAPEESQFWRWHNEGKGMLSTVEAIYFSAWQATEDELQRSKLIYLLWIFGLQRAAIQKASIEENRPPPFTDEGKEEQRKLRDRKLQEELKNKKT
jgi:hypothetical protein